MCRPVFIQTHFGYVYNWYNYLLFTKMYFLLQVIAPTALFLAAKVEEQPKKLEHVIKVCWFLDIH